MIWKIYKISRRRRPKQIIKIKMMKKTYISPKFLLVELRCTQMMAESMFVDTESSAPYVSNTNGGWAKENNSTVRDVNLWDNEW